MTWNLIADTSAAPCGPLLPGTSVGFQWQDPTNGGWSVNGSGHIVALTSTTNIRQLQRPSLPNLPASPTTGVNENTVDQRGIIDFVASAATAWMLLRFNTMSAPRYRIGMDPASGAVNLFVDTSFSPSSTPVATLPGIAPTLGHTYELDVQCVQQSGPTQTAFAVNLTDTSAGAAIITNGLITDAIGPQNPTGPSTLALAADGAAEFARVRFSTDVAVTAMPECTGYAVASIPATAVVGTPYQGGVTTNSGGNNLAAPLVVTFATTNGGTVTPNPVVVQPGQGSVNFVYRPVAGGAETVSWSYSGGNAGMTGDGSQAVSAVAYLAFGGRAPGASTPIVSDNWQTDATGAITTVSPGAYIKFGLRNPASASLLIDVTNLRTGGGVPANQWPTLRIADVSATAAAPSPVDVQLADPGGNTLTLDLLPYLGGLTTKTIAVTVASVPTGVSRWTPNASGFPPAAVRILGITSAAFLAVPSLSAAATRIHFYGDNFGEGVLSVPPASDSEGTWVAAMAQGIGAEYGSFCYAGMSLAGSLGTPDTPVLPASWPSFWSGASKLSSGAVLTNNGSLSPDFVAICIGANDVTAPAANTLVNMLTAMKAAYPRARLVVITPPSNFNSAVETFIATEFANYLMSDPSAIKLVTPPMFNSGLNVAAPNPYSPDGINLLAARNATLGAWAAGALIQATAGTSRYVAY